MTLAVQRIYSGTDFAALPAPAIVNIDTLRDDVASQVYAGDPPLLQLIGPKSVLATWSPLLPIAADVAIVTARIAAHTGGAISSAPVRVVSVANVDTPANGAETSVLTLDYAALVGAPVAAGVYMVSGSVMYRMVAEVASARAVVGLYFNGLLRKLDAWRFTDEHTYSFAEPVPRTAGQNLVIEIRVARMGGASGVARAFGLVPTTAAGGCAINVDKQG